MHMTSLISVKLVSVLPALDIPCAFYSTPAICVCACVCAYVRACVCACVCMCVSMYEYLVFCLVAQPTQEVVTQTRHNHYIVTWMISPLLESYFESFRIQYRPIRPDGTVGPRVVADPAVPKEDRTYDLSFPVGGKYQIEVLTQPLDLEVFKAIVDIG